VTVPGGGIEASGLVKRFGPVTVLDGITFATSEGSKTALLGANGAGKSTLLALLSTLASPNAGSARVAGFDVGREGAEVRRRIGVLAHRPMVYEELSALENLRFFARLYEVLESEPRIEELLRRVGLWRRRHEPAEVLSRGYHQRLAMARALVHSPPVLLVDEPETGLDDEGLALLDELVLEAPGLTVLAATHRRERVDRWADGVVEIVRGRVAGAKEDEPAIAASTGA